jgi:hypothetical protein
LWPMASLRRTAFVHTLHGREIAEDPPANARDMQS